MAYLVVYDDEASSLVFFSQPVTGTSSVAPAANVSATARSVTVAGTAMTEATRRTVDAVAPSSPAATVRAFTTPISATAAGTVLREATRQIVVPVTNLPVATVHVSTATEGVTVTGNARMGAMKSTAQVSVPLPHNIADRVLR